MIAAWLLPAVIGLAGLDEDDWLCVPSEDGRNWECGQGDEAPQRRSLPDSLPPLGSPPRGARPTDDAADSAAATEDQTALPATLAAPRTSPRINTLQKPEATSRPPEDDRPTSPRAYALQLATVDSTDAVADFASSFEVDPGRASRAAVIESGTRRQALLYGRYDSPAEALAAIDELPALLQALKPQVVTIADLAGPPVPLMAAAADPGAVALDTPASEDPTAPESAAAQETMMPIDPPKQARRETVPESRPTSSPETARRSAPREAPASADRPRSSLPATRSREAAEVVPGHEAFAREEGRYTIQLANLANQRAAAEFIARHGLSDAPIYGLAQADGRILVLVGRFVTLTAAESALAGLPPGLGTPWIRRAEPLLN